jgi:homoserine dehydrogenase
VAADVVAAARHVASGQPALSLRPDEKKCVKPMSQIVTRYYIRMAIADHPGVLAQVASSLGANNISIASAIQKGTAPDQTAEIVIMTHPAREDAIQAAFADFKKLAVVKEVHNFVRVEA